MIAVKEKENMTKTEVKHLEELLKLKKELLRLLEEVYDS